MKEITLDTTPQEIPYREDFSLLLDFLDAEGAASPMPLGDRDFRLVFSASMCRNTYVAAHGGDEWFNCHVEDDRLHVIFAGHKLIGQLHMRVEGDLPDSCFPGCARTVNRRYCLPVMFTDRCSRPYTDSVEVTVPMATVTRTSYDLAVAQGYKGTMEEYMEAMTDLPSVMHRAETLEAKLIEDTAAMEKALKDAATWRDDIDGKQDALASSPTIKINADNTLSTTEMVEKAAFIRRWNLKYDLSDKSGYHARITIARYDETTDEFVVNPGTVGEVRLTYAEAIEAEQASSRPGFPVMAMSNAHAQLWLPYARASQAAADLSPWRDCPLLEVIGSPVMVNKGWWPTYRAGGFNPTMRMAFYRCAKLKHIFLKLDYSAGGAEDGYVSAKPFINCTALETVYIYGLKTSISFQACSRLSLTSLQYMIANSTHTASQSAITITVHRAVYNRLTGADESLSETEAQAYAKVLADAQAKNIVFAC